MVSWKTSDPVTGTVVSYRNDGTGNTGFVSEQNEPLGQSISLSPPVEPQPPTYEAHLFDAYDPEWQCSKVPRAFYGSFEGMPDHCQIKALHEADINGPDVLTSKQLNDLPSYPCPDYDDGNTIRVCTRTPSNLDYVEASSGDPLPWGDQKRADCLSSIYRVVPSEMHATATVAVPLLKDAADGIGYTMAQFAYLLATVEHESHLGSLMNEIWGPSSYQSDYEPHFDGSGRITNQRARELGNTQVGDGKRYLGRGYVQITGRGAYARFGALFMFSAALASVASFDVSSIANYDLQAYPEKASDPANAARIAALGVYTDLFKMRGRHLSDVIKVGTFEEYLKARGFIGGRYINGIDVGSAIANRALNYLEAMKGGCP